MGLEKREFLLSEWIFVALCFVITIARLAVRSWHGIWSFWLSEIFLVVSVLFFLTLVVGDTYTMSMGKDAFKDEYFDESFAKWKFASSIIFDLGFYFPRFSLLAFYYELFPAAEKKLRLCLHLVTAYSACAFFTTGFVDLFWCGADISRNWADSDTSCTLANCPEPMYINWSIGIISELLVFALPFGILRLKALRAKDRRALLCIFLLGIATVIISAARFYLTVQSIWSLETYLVGSAEIATQIIVIALPALRPLLGALTRGWDRYSDSRIQSRSRKTVNDIQQTQQASGTAASNQGSGKLPTYADTVSITTDAKLPEP
ncbi:hypothetical protein LZ30DRAFT_720890 [Colletotrichum cereale]|nr:hypothetical protein LZ30DRAFT_720890 [Colletotrichum cereale]